MAHRSGPQPFRCYDCGAALLGFQLCDRHPDGARVPWSTAAEMLWKTAAALYAKRSDPVAFLEGLRAADTSFDDAIFADGAPWSAVPDRGRIVPPMLDQVANRVLAWRGVLPPFPTPAPRPKRSKPGAILEDDHL